MVDEQQLNLKSARFLGLFMIPFLIFALAVLVVLRSSGAAGNFPRFDPAAVLVVLAVLAVAEAFIAILLASKVVSRLSPHWKEGTDRPAARRALEQAYSTAAFLKLSAAGSLVILGGVGFLITGFAPTLAVSAVGFLFSLLWLTSRDRFQRFVEDETGRRLS